MAHFTQIWPPIFFSFILSILDVRNFCKLSPHAFSRKTNEPNLRKWQITYFQAQFCPISAQIWPQKFILFLLNVRHCCKLSLYAISWKSNEPNLRKWQKKLVSGKIFPSGPNLGPKVFLWILPVEDVRHFCKLSLYAISRKTNEPNMRKWKKKTSLGLILAHLAQIWTGKTFIQESGFVSH